MTDTDLEHRLRRALSARATAVTSRDLRPETTPAPDRRTRARWWPPLAAGVTAAAVTITAFALLRPTDPAPAPPASPPSPAQPSVPVPRTPGAPVAPSGAAPAPSASSAEATPTAGRPGRTASAPGGDIEATPR